MSELSTEELELLRFNDHVLDARASYEKSLTARREALVQHLMLCVNYSRTPVSGYKLAELWNLKPATTHPLLRECKAEAERRLQAQ